jgi:penicillin amidase
LRAERDQPLFKGWRSVDADVERARAMIEGWNKVLTKDSTPAAIYVRWTATEAARQRDAAKVVGTKGQTLVEAGLRQALDRATKDWGADWTQWRYGRINNSTLDHQFIPEYSLSAVERPGGFNTVNATGANFRRIVDLSNVDNSVWTNAPGQSGQPGSPFYGNNRELLASGQYQPLPHTRGGVEKILAYKLTITP